jgi:MinD-like ATPase involved in chromosome partitioning or flagellar assembly
MKIVTFYSYKGGTGRSLTLANVACALRLSLQQTVGLVDLDCEAAALHELFRVDPQLANLLSLLLPKNRSVTNVERHVVTFTVGGSSDQIHLLPSVTDSSLIDEIHWDGGVESFLRDEVFPTFGKLFELDYLLIDARSGVSTFAQFALRVCDLVVIVGRADRQHASGLSRMFRVCQVAGQPFKFILSGCPSPERNGGKIEQFSRDVGRQPDFIIPYTEELYFDEIIMTQREPNAVSSKRFTEIARTIHEFSSDLS